MSSNGLQTAVLEAGGHIEDRMLISDFPNFTPVYTFTREALEDLLKNERERCATIADKHRHHTEMLTSFPPQSAAARDIANEIRGLGNP